MRPLWTRCYVGAGVVLMTVQPLLVKASQRNGQYEYEVVTCTLLSEVLKLAVSLVLYRTAASPGERAHASVHFDLMDAIKFAVPAGVYFVNNTMVFAIVSLVTPSSFQVVGSLKTVFTALLFRAVLKRRLSLVKWVCVLLLACGTAVAELPSGCAETVDLPVSQDQGSGEGTNGVGDHFLGVLLILVSCFLSAFAGVFSELLLKKDGHRLSIHFQNAVLYGWGVLFGVFGVSMSMWRNPHRNLFDGYSGWVIMIILNQALTGLVISAILKRADNIVRVFAHTAAMMLTLGLEHAVQPSEQARQLVIAIVIVGLSTLAYSQEPRVA